MHDDDMQPLDQRRIRDEFEEHRAAQRYYAITMLTSSVIAVSFFVMALGVLIGALRGKME